MLPPRIKLLFERLDPKQRELVVRYAESLAEEDQLLEALTNGRPTGMERRRIEEAIAAGRAWRAKVERC